jgi:hypothetical protein
MAAREIIQGLDALIARHGLRHCARVKEACAGGRSRSQGQIWARTPSRGRYMATAPRGGPRDGEATWTASRRLDSLSRLLDEHGPACARPSTPPGQ